MRLQFLFALLALPLAACIQTHVIVEQPKPLELNVNLAGRLDLVIHDARDDLEKINGEKPTNIVRPEDIGLPPKAGTAVKGDAGTFAATPTETWTQVSLRSPQPRIAIFTAALADDLTASMKARNAQVRALWDSQAVGESYTGLLVVKGKVTDAQQKIIDAENADRAALYAAKAKEKKITTDEAALAYYLERLGYAKKGAWYQVRNTKGEWEWKQWAGT